MMGPTLRALHQVDVEALEKCIAQGSGHPGMIFGNAEGATLQRMELPQFAGGEFPGGSDHPAPVLGDLGRGGAEGGGADPSRHDRHVDRQEEQAVEVELSDGGRERYDLLVGADGLHSAVRELVFPDAPRPYFNGQTVWRAMVPRPPDLGDDMGMYYGPRNKSGCNPLSETEAYVFLVENARRSPRPPRERWPELIREQLSDYGGVIGWARERMTDPERIDCRPLQVFLLPSPWYRGRVLLIGDAAHATTPHLAMGAGIAIEDRMVLAEE